MKTFSKKREYLERIIKLLIGCFLLAIAYNLFLVPNDLIPGGVSGLAIILNYVFGIPNFIFIFVTNIILLLLSFLLLGKEQTKDTVLGSLIFPLFIRLTEPIHTYFLLENTPVLLSAIFGGVLFGLGIGLIYRVGYTTGGTDIINQIMNKYLKISIGKSILLSDGIIVLISFFILPVNNIMYSIIILYLVSTISDKVILGVSSSKCFFIMTKKEDEVKEYIIKNLKHGVTSLLSEGGYSKQKGTLLMTSLPTKEYYKLKEGIKKIDPEAFYIVTDTYEVVGGE